MFAHDFPLAPITADDVRTAPVEPGRARQRHWCRYFAERLGEHNLIHDGDWALVVSASRSELWSVSPQRLVGLERTLDLPSPLFLNWVPSGSGQCLPIRPRPEHHEGRVKYWRKLARADHLPPLLLWWVTGLDCYVLIDGHRRLLAATLERRHPPIVAVYSFVETARWRPPIEELERIDRERGQRVRAGPLTLQAAVALERRVAQIHDDRPWLEPRTRAWYRPR